MMGMFQLLAQNRSIRKIWGLKLVLKMLLYLQRRKVNHHLLRPVSNWFALLVLISVAAQVQVRSLLMNKQVKMACSIAVCVKLRSSSIASTVEFVTSVLIALIIIADGSTIVLGKGTTGNFSPLWLLLSSWYVHGLCTLGLGLQLILQWVTGILVLICCFIEKKKFSADIASQLGSSFSLVPFVIVVAVCTILAMMATLPLAQLFFFHILLIKKGISTYDYIIALREQEQEQQGIGGQQSPQMSPVSSLTGMSSASSFTTFHRGAWCTPPRLFLEDQFDVVPPETASVSSSLGRKTMKDEPVKKKNPGAVKISPWTLARLNAEEVSKAAAEARKKSKILQPVTRHNNEPFRLEPDRNSGSSSRRMSPRIENNRRRAGKRIRLPADLPMEAIPKFSASSTDKGFSGPSSLVPLQLKARSAFQTSQAVSSSAGIVASSPESSIDSPDIHPFHVSTTEAEEARRLAGISAVSAASLKGIPLSRSTSDGYEASGGEDSDRVPTRIVQRSTNWTNLLFSADQEERAFEPKSSSSMVHIGKL
ncbi:probable protein S-acyltransferase 22 isoform X2 [Cajanus cajan]|uniref:probable protein S-acyltransferase 22 isoform X2 n=1 Tax=Cajanus cajan TaxID=3821 RepID=UPI00098D8413|nr:probable protein S-acyltransferase 22 isoform X2 [Cajanus cajan]